ncbi:MAG: phosphatidylglycerophosphate synthase [Isosphaeraceae bacterium]
MSHGHPTLADLRATVQKQRYREIGNWLARRVARPTAVYGSWVAVRLGLSAHQVTLAALAASLGGALAIGTGSRAGFVLGVALAHLGFWLDHVDGQVARWRGTACLDGVYLDYVMHHMGSFALGFGLGFGLASRSGQPAWALAGFAIAGGWALLSLHNDCLYKAFFQRLKSAGGTYLVAGGSGSRPSPPASWPKRGIGLLSWPLYKVCEPHVVLMIITGLAVLAGVRPSLWLFCWRSGTLVMAMLAPLLGAARIARSVTRGSAEAEFSRWFHPAAPSALGVPPAAPFSAHRPLDSRVARVVSPSE